MTSGDRAQIALDGLGAMLTSAHRLSREQPIVGPNADGVFPELVGLDSLGIASQVPPIVPDTNVLRNDLGRSVRRSERTVLVNAANAGAIRLLCPVHVIEEMDEHTVRFSDEMQLSVADFRRAWQRDYLPLLRIVDQLPSGLWTADEEERLAELDRRDPDDVPAARLALATGAYFLSTDGAALAAVYGAEVDPVDHEGWVEDLKAGGNAHELAKIVEVGAVLLRVVATATAEVGRGVRRSTAGATLVAGGAAVLVAYLAADSERRQRVRSAASGAAVAALVAVDRYMSALDHIQQRAAPTPTKGAFRESTSPMPRLVRGCLAAACRGSSSTWSAAELRSRLGSIGVPSGEAKVRSVLRENSCFFEAYPGRFQLGRSADALSLHNITEIGIV